MYSYPVVIVATVGILGALAMAQNSGSTGPKAVVPTPATKPAPPPTTQPVKGHWKGNDWIPSWDTCHAYYRERARTEDLQLVFIGDSLTWGWTQNKDVFEKHFGALRAAQFGIIGDTTQYVLWRLADGELEHMSPKVIVLLIGANNLGTATTQAVADGVQATIKLIQSKQPNAKVLLLSIFPLGKQVTPLRARIKETNTLLAKLADGKAVRYLDIYDKFCNADGTQIDGLFQPDECHLEKPGYEKWASSVEDAIKEMMGPAATAPATKPAK